MKKQPRGNNAQQVDRTKPRQANETGNKPRVPAWVYALDKQQAPESVEAMEGKNFENEIFLRGRECEGPEKIFYFILLYFIF